MTLLLAALLSAVDPPAVSVKADIAPGKGITVKSDDGAYALTVRARVQLRDTLVHAASDTNELNVARLRLYLQGNVLSPDLKYLVQLAAGALDLEAGNPSPVYDAFIEYTGFRDANVRAGQFFVPFDRARTIRESSLQFVDRQLAVRELTLDRDIGLMVSSQDVLGLGGRLAYAFFIGGGDGKNRAGPQLAGPLTVLRLTLRPFGAFDDDLEGDLTRDARPRLAVGLAGAYNVHATRAQSTFGATYTLGTFDYWHGAADLVFKWRGFSLLTEAVIRRSDRRALDGVNESGAAVHEYSRSGWGYFVQAGVMLSQYVEVTARWDQLYALPNTDPALTKLAGTQGRQLGAGLNVYVIGHVLKVQADYFYVWGANATSGTHAARLVVDASL